MALNTCADMHDYSHTQLLTVKFGLYSLYIGLLKNYWITSPWLLYCVHKASKCKTKTSVRPRPHLYKEPLPHHANATNLPFIFRIRRPCTVPVAARAVFYEWELMTEDSTH